MNNQEIIKSIFTNPSTGYKSSLNTYKTFKKLHPNLKITKKEVQEYINNLSTHQIHTNQKINKDDYNQITANGKGFFQIDLIDMGNYKSHNNNYRFILIGVDIESRYSFVIPLKTKKTQEVYDGFLKMYKQVEKDKHRIYATYQDKGSEWNLIKKHKEDLNIKMFFKQVENHRGSGIVDRRIRFFRDLLEKYFTQNNTLKWIDILDKINDNINNTINRTIKEEPVNVWTGKTSSKQEIKTNDKPVDKFKVGDSVRVKNDTNNFSKNSTGLYSNKLYKIISIDGLGFYVNGLDRKLFPVDVKLVKGGKDLNEIDKLRNKNKKNNSIKRKLQKEGIF